MATADAQVVADHILSHGFDLWVWTDTDWYVTSDVVRMLPTMKRKWAERPPC